MKFLNLYGMSLPKLRLKQLTKVRAALMQQISELISGQDWTPEQAATQCNVTQPRLNELLQGRVSKFTLEALVNIAAALGQVVRVKLE